MTPELQAGLVIAGGIFIAGFLIEVALERTAAALECIAEALKEKRK